ncbi:MAG: DUF6364 family protein [Sulfurimonadaceae bacterium]|jgi:hypothetical protein|nr:DUF6364 family protein [Sulfurimonadaceae bacterium]
MAQVTIYMDSNLEENVKKLAKSTGVSISKFISNILEQKVSSSWDNDVRKLSGSWSDDTAFSEDLRTNTTADIKREEFKRVEGLSVQNWF